MGFFAGLSMKAELIFHDDPRQANFCSSKFGVLPSGQVVLACHPFRAMAKAGKVPELGFAGPESIVALLRDYSSTPNFWPIHLFARKWLSHMGYSFESAPSALYECPMSPAQLQTYLDNNPPNRDGSWILPFHPALHACFEQEGLVEDPANAVNFSHPAELLGLPPKWGRPGWVRKARALRDKLLRFWRTEYIRWSPRLDHRPVGQGDAPANYAHEV